MCLKNGHVAGEAGKIAPGNSLLLSVRVYFLFSGNVMTSEVRLKYDLETVDCALCGSDDYHIWISRAKELYNGFEEYFDVVRCGQCGFVFTNPRPTPETISVFYPDSAGYYQPKKDRTSTKATELQKLRAMLKDTALAELGYPRKPHPVPRFLWRGELRRLCFAHVPRYVPDGRLLDIGCAWGGYLSRMRDLGWEVHGIELNPGAAGFARDELDMKNVHCGSFNDLDYPEEYFDVVHMSMALEHLHHPFQALKKISSLLRRGGQLIVSVPDVSGFEMRLFRDKCYTLQVPQHLSHFSPETLSRFMEKAGFTVDDILHQKSKKDFIKSAEYLDRNDIRRLWTNPVIKNFFLGLFVSVLARMGKTSRMSVFARKNGDG